MTAALDVLEPLIEATYTGERVQHLRQANLDLHLDGFDHFVTEVLRAPYLRYVVRPCPACTSSARGARACLAALERNGCCRKGVVQGATCQRRARAVPQCQDRSVREVVRNNGERIVRHV